MSWEPGDLALCVNASPPMLFGEQLENNSSARLMRGSVYVVDAINEANDESGDIGLYLDVDPSWGWISTRFRKVTPPKADEFDHEIISAMTGEPVGV